MGFNHTDQNGKGFLKHLMRLKKLRNYDKDDPMQLELDFSVIIGRLDKMQ